LHKRFFAEKSDYPIYKGFLRITNARTCLEIGCDGGRLSRLLIDQVEKLECQDISAKAIAICQTTISADKLPRVRFRCGSVSPLYADATDRFDIALSNSVLSAVKPGDIAATIQTLARISKYVAISELMPGERGATYYWFAHDYKRLFADAGMTLAKEVTSGEQRFQLYSHNTK
jgi:2-polyprenyl-3-methyl-5-hydroxy-6-metoxy-1,4-benzoquinol methylase